MKIRLLAPLVLAIACLFADAGDGLKKTPPIPDVHTKRDIEGWTVHIDDRLLKGEGKELGDRALRILSNRLYDIKLVLPADKVARLAKSADLDRSIRTASSAPPSIIRAPAGLKRTASPPIWPSASTSPPPPTSPACTISACSPGRCCTNWPTPTTIRCSASITPTSPPPMPVSAKSGKYKSVLHINGKKVPHYGLTNPMEFFAEMTETYFGQNDFFPFNRAELKREEPEIYDLMAKIWGPLPKS